MNVRFCKKGLAILLLLMTVSTTVFAAGGVAHDVNVWGVSSPGENAYWKDGSQNVIFKLYAEDTNNAGTLKYDVNCYIALSVAHNDFNFPIKPNAYSDKWTMRAGSYCSASDFNTTAGVTCTIPFTLSSAYHPVGDGNYKIDINCYSVNPATFAAEDANGAAADNNSFVIDTNVPRSITSFGVSDLKGGKFKLSWDANTTSSPRAYDFNTYKIYYTSGSNITTCSSETQFWDTTLADPTIGSVTVDVGLSDEKPYLFCMYVQDRAGNDSATIAYAGGTSTMTARGYIPKKTTTTTGTIPGLTDSTGKLNPMAVIVIVGALIGVWYILSPSKKKKGKKRR